MLTKHEQLELRNIADRIAKVLAAPAHMEIQLDLRTARLLVELIDKATAPEMPTERAREITKQCVKSAFSRVMGDGEWVDLPDCTLEEMLVANRIIGEIGPIREGKTKKMQMTVDPRGIALHYAYEHFGRSPYQLLEALGFEFKSKRAIEREEEERKEQVVTI